MSTTQRAWVYRVLVILSILAIGFGLVTEEQAAAWVAAAAALLGNGLATINTTTRSAD
jgi:hypothetical protein